VEPLSGLDASFLYLEHQSQPLHVCALFVLDVAGLPGGYDFGRFRAALHRRARRWPEFRRLLRPTPLPLGRPAWHVQPDVDIGRHVRRHVVEGSAELAGLCGELAALPLDRSLPLWEMHVVEGLADGQVAVFAKFHHAVVDGVAAANLVVHLCDPTPEETDDGSASEPVADSRVAPVRVLDAVVRWPWELAQLTWRTLPILPDWLARFARGEAMPLPFTAPRLSFNRPITDTRAVAFAGMPLADVKRVKNAFGCTVNDVVLATVAGALRRYLAARGELPSVPLIAMVPVAVRESRPTVGTNRVTGMFSSLPTHLADPGERVRAAARATQVAKQQHVGIDPLMLYDWARLLVSDVLGVGASLYARFGMADWHPAVYNVLVSTVAGPPMPLYLAGGRVVGLYPFGPVFHGVGLNITAVSYAGDVNVGVLACHDLVPDPAEIAAQLPAALDELVAACV